MRVLYIDDEKSLCELMLCSFAKKRFHGEIKAYSNGEEGVHAFFNSLLEKNPFDVVITDLWMRPLNGLDIGKVIKEHSPKTKLVVVSGESFDLKEYPFVDAFLAKPFLYGELLSQLE